MFSTNWSVLAIICGWTLAWSVPCYADPALDAQNQKLSDAQKNIQSCIDKATQEVSNNKSIQGSQPNNLKDALQKRIDEAKSHNEKIFAALPKDKVVDAAK